MRDTRLIRHTGAWLSLAVAGLLLQACSDNKAPELPTSGGRVYAADMTGAAKLCEAPKLSPSAGQTAEAAMKIGNDGGWCGLIVTQRNGSPFEAGLLTTRAARGTVMIHRVGDATRIDYTPDRGYVGSDSFSVKLLPGNAVVHVTATVTGPSAK